MSKVQPTLFELTSKNEISYVLTETIKELFGKKGEHYSKLPHGVVDSSWETGGHVRRLSNELEKEIIGAVHKLVENKYKKFSDSTSKLTPELMDEIWIIISSWIGKKIEQQAHQEETEIPGLKYGVEQGDILVAGNKHNVQETTVDDRENARTEFLEKLPRVNDEILLLQKFRNNLYQYYKEKYGIFEEGLAEPKSEYKMRRK